MKFQLKYIPLAILLFLFSAISLTGCHTVEGAFKGAGQDVAVLMDQNGQYHHKKTYTKPAHKPVAATPSTKVTTTTTTTTTNTTTQQSNMAK